MLDANCLNYKTFRKLCNVSLGAGLYFCNHMGTNGRKKAVKIILWFFGIVVVLLLIIAVITPPVAKRLVEKHDVEYTGREITVGSILLNPFTVALSVRDLAMFEQESDTVFMSVSKFKVNLSLLKLLRGIYEIRSVKVTQPEIRVIRDDSIFNFADLIEKFAPEDTVSEELKLNVRNISLKDGTLRYYEKNMPVEIGITEINFYSEGMFWDVDTITGEFSFIPGSGNVSGDIMIHQDSLDYRMAMLVENLDAGMFEPYLDEMAGRSNLEALINLDIKSSGNFNRPLDGRASGKFEMKDVRFGPSVDNEFFRLERFLVSFSEIDMEENRFYFDSVLIDKPAVLYAMYDTLDNFRRMFSSWLAKEAEKEVKEEVDSISFLLKMQGLDYNVKTFDLNEGRIEFNDYSIAEKFSMVIVPFNIKADSINKDNRRVKIGIDGGIVPAGNFNADLSMDPEDENNFAFTYEFRNIPAPLFNPYIITYSSYQLDRGTVEMHGTWDVVDSKINSLNHFIVVDPRNYGKVKGKDTKWVPLPLILSLTREQGGAIDYEIPVKGDLNDPSFKLSDVISDILKNILVKPPATPYRLQVRKAESKIEKILSVKWKMRRARVEDGQDKFLEEIADFLKDNPEASLVVQPIMHAEKEKENLLLFEAKKKYFIESGKIEGPKLKDKDSMEVDNMSIREKEFIRYLDKAIKDPGLLTLQEKCARFIGWDLVNKRYEELVEMRRTAFLDFFKDNDTDKRIEILDVKNQVPVNWFSYYKIDYKGDIPEELEEAFNKLFEFNTEPPRREYLPFRRR
jgi:hypothetical protein